MTEIKEKYDKTVEYERVTKVICDWCRKDMPPDDPSREDYYSKIQYTIEHYNCRDGGHRIGWKVADLCQSCATQLRRLLESAGIKVIEVDDDW